MELAPGLDSFAPDQMFSDGARLFLSGSTTGEPGLWVSDGTSAGTRRISDAYLTGGPAAWSSFAGRIYFSSMPGGEELCVTDGTEAGTHPLRTAGGQPLRRVKSFLPFGSRLLVLTREGELWQTNGTEAGTALVRNLAPAPLPFDGLELVRAGSRAFFPGWSAESGWELWAMPE